MGMILDAPETETGTMGARARKAITNAPRLKGSIRPSRLRVPSGTSSEAGSASTRRRSQAKSSLTVTLGLRVENEKIPTFRRDVKDYAFQFGFGDKLAPRLGLVYDIFGDSSLKIFASFGMYYDVMKLYMAEGAYGGFKWWTSYYTLDTWDWTKIAANGDINDRASLS